MTERQQVRNLISVSFPNGYDSNPVSGYCHYILRDEKGTLRIEHLTTGMILRKGEIAIPPKYYETPKEMYEDLKFYFNPR